MCSCEAVIQFTNASLTAAILAHELAKNDDHVKVFFVHLCCMKIKNSVVSGSAPHKSHREGSAPYKTHREEEHCEKGLVENETHSAYAMPTSVGSSPVASAAANRTLAAIDERSVEAISRVFQAGTADSRG